MQQLADDRVLDAEALLNAGRWSGAYYLSGYAVGCALKACFARRINLHDFPDKAQVLRSYSHDLADLLDLAGLTSQFKLSTMAAANPALGRNWQTLKDWNERTRYEQQTEIKARGLYQAVTDISAGILPWVKSHW